MLISWGSIVALAYSIVLVQASVSYEKECSGMADHLKLFPHENCHQFYLCVNGNLIVKNCPEGLLYNRETQVCDGPRNVVCEQIKTSEIQNSNYKAESTICAEDSSNIMVAHENCNQFYFCSFGNAIAFYCAHGLFFNPEKQVCDWSFNVDCEGRRIPEELANEHEKVKASSEAIVVCAEPGSNGKQIAHENCDQFYKCLAGTPIALFCPNDLLYNPQKQVCDWSFNVDCEGRRKAKELASENEKVKVSRDAAAICAEEQSNFVFVPHEKCDHFYVCLDGKSVAMKCLSGLLFNPALNVCDWPSNVECSGRIVVQ